MSDSVARSPLRFEPVDLDVFARASGDLNPLHWDELYAHKTVFGRPIVYGCLVALSCLQRFRRTSSAAIRALAAEFPKPALVGVEYEVVEERAGADTTVLEVRDGRVVLGRVTLHTAARSAADAAPWPSRAADAIQIRERRLTARAWADGERLHPLSFTGVHVVDEEPIRRLQERWGLLAEDDAVVRALCLCSYVLGMEIPGRDALFGGLTLRFDGERASAPPDLAFQLATREFDEAFGLLRLALQASAAAGQRCEGELWAFLRRRVPATPIEVFARGLHGTGEPWRGKVALVTGGSRGLGAALVKALALQGAHVVCAFFRSAEEAAALQEEVRAAGGRVTLAQGDLRDPAHCEQLGRRLLAELGGLDLLVCNAFAVPEYLDVSPRALRRLQNYVADNLALTATPLLGLLELVAAARGTVCLVSSAYAEQSPRGMPHYAAAKRAAEGLLESAARTHGDVSFCLVRPSRLLTDMTNSPGTALGAGDAATFGVELARELALPRGPGLHLLGTTGGSVSSAPPSRPAREERIAVASTFTADPIVPIIGFWARVLRWPVRAEVVPYDQVIQQLLDRTSALHTNDAGMNVLLLNLSDALRRPAGAAGGVATPSERLNGFVGALSAAIRDYAASCPVFTWVLLCPPSGPAAGDARVRGEILAAEQALTESLRGIPRVECRCSQDLDEAYQPDDYLDPLRDSLGHMPYTPAYEHVLGTLVARRYHALRSRAVEVVVCGGEGTLWTRSRSGAARIGERQSSLHRILAEKSAQGLLLALVDAGHPEQAWSALESGVLQPDHFVATRFGSDAPAAALRSLASELGLDLGSFLFVHHDPSEIERVAAACPEVRGLVWPRPGGHEGELRHVWSLDQGARQTQGTPRRLDRATEARIAAELASARQILAAAGAAPSAPVTQDPEREQRPDVLPRLREVFARVLALDPAQLTDEGGLEDYGIDSLKNIELMVELGKHFEGLPPTLLFEHRTLSSIARFIDVDARPQKPARASAGPATATPARAEDGIAVIGMNGLFPGARDVEELWRVLEAGGCTIREVPPERWDASRYFDPTGTIPHKSYSRWGGFLEDVGRFEASFFRITPREATLMDPQQRLLLQVAYGLLEDAGYTRASLGPDTGVFVGAIATDYGLLTSDAALRGFSHYRNADAYQIANRISYHFDFRGPSLTLDTACSSSGTAIHLACEALRRGECATAIVGGVNLFLHPARFVQYAQMQIPSRSGCCRPFGAEADGTVFGEGIAALLLKPLAAARRDRDHVYGVIRGTAVNSGGRTNGFTVPNPEAQAAVVSRALERAGVDPRTISYVEAHGTGTVLGDPIEVRGLTMAFERLAGASGAGRGFCRLGSLKGNIGHLESAAAVTGAIKILLQMKHGRLAASLHAREVNPRIRFEQTPFVVQQEAGPWDPPARVPRRAGLSTFGAGGSNAHIVLEEEPAAAEPVPAGRHVFPLSSTDHERLRAQIGDLAGFLAREAPAAADGPRFLAQIAFTLQVGREPLDARAAVLASSLDELQSHLRQVLEGRSSAVALVGDRSRDDAGPAADEVAAALVARDLEVLARAWVSGAAVDWSRLHEGAFPGRVPLPRRRFAGENYWLPREADTRAARLHPLLDRNESTADRVLFTKELTERDFAVADHVVGARRMLAGAALLEMARAAGQLASGQAVTGIREVVWAQPVVLDAERVRVDVRLRRGPDGLGFVVVAGGRSDEAWSATGELRLDEIPEDSARADLAELRGRCPEAWTSARCYRFFELSGLAYGPGFQVIRELWRGSDESVARLVLPEHLRPDADEYGLHPALVDGAFQAILPLLDPAEAPYLPFHLKAARIGTATAGRSAHAHIRRIRAASPAERVFTFAVRIVDEQGRMCVEFEAFSLRSSRPATPPPQPSRTALLVPTWRHAAVRPAASGASRAGVLLVLAADTETFSALRPAAASCLLVRPGKEFHALPDGTYEVDPVQEHHYRQLLAVVAERGPLRGIVHAWADPRAVLEQRVQRSFDSLFLLSRALLAVRCELPPDLLFVFSRRANEAPAALEAGLDGLLRTARHEHPALAWRGVEVVVGDGEPTSVAMVSALLHELSGAGREAQVRWLGAERQAQRWVEAGADELSGGGGLKQRGRYLITGGAGGLGCLVSEHLVDRVEARLVLVGRRDEDEACRIRIARWRERGGDAVYVRADVRRQEDVRAAVARARERFGGLDGVIHAAGITRDRLLQAKTLEEARDVVDTKLLGVRHLDLATAREPLDFFLSFSSIAAVLGNVGQSDYACANSLLLSHAQEREWLRSRGERSGRTLAVAWPLWADGGMRVSADQERRLLQDLGIVPLPTAEGLQLFERVSGASGSVVIFHGDRRRLEAVLDAADAPAPVADEPLATREVPREFKESRLRDGLERLLKGVLCDETHLPLEKVALRVPFETYGIDSLMVVRMTEALERSFGKLSKTLFFEHKSIADLGQYFLEHHRHRVTELFGGAAEGALDAPAEEPAFRRVAAPSVPVVALARSAEPALSAHADVAIVGLAGRYPKARTLDEFWANLVEGKDCITEIPPERWDALACFDPDRRRTGTTYSRWGGFLDGVDLFDPLFFGISPREAELMDPQERLFLECAWQAVEDAGHTRATLRELRTGVFVGVMWSEYQLYGAEQALRGHPVSLGASFGSIANRVSHVLDLRGPSLALDTMCSSSLTALHLACESLRRGECEAAIAGGVNLTLHPNKYLQLAQGQFASSDGRCRSFGEGGDGYVPGEGVGAVLLKPLSRALADGDHIHGVIKGTAVNHGGRTSGYTVPSPHAQGAAIAEALSRSGVDARTVSYVEAHGTGTSLGDPIEVAGLAKAYGEWTQARQYCAIGSVKSNIGHLESAAGIAGVTKVLLQMRYGQLVPSLHSGRVNPNIAFEDSPFRVQRELAAWERPQVEGRAWPRRAGVSSFGAGGSNAHVVLEEYEAQAASQAGDGAPQLVVLSARSEPQLREVAERLGAALGQRRAEPSPASGRVAEVEAALRAALASPLGLRPEDVDESAGSAALSLDQEQFARTLAAVCLRFGAQPSASMLEGDVTLGSLARRIAAQVEAARAARADVAPALSDVAYTLQVGREAHEHRLAVVAASRADLVEALRAWCHGERAAPVFTGRVSDAGPEGVLVDVEEGPDFVRSLARRGRLSELARLWVGGVDLPWEALHARRPRRTALPTYPFARRRCWVPGAPVGPWWATTPSAEPTTATAATPLAPQVVMRVLKPGWQRAPVREAARPARPRRVLFLTHAGTLDLAGRLATQIGVEGAVFVRERPAGDGPGADAYQLCYSQAEDGTRLAETLRQQASPVTTVVDLSDLRESSTGADGSLGKWALLQGLVRARQNSLEILHLTRGLELFDAASTSLAGADVAGLVRMLASECGRVVSRTVDVDVSPAEAGALAEIVRRELDAVPGEASVCYRKGERYVEALLPAELGQSEPLELRPDDVFVVSGGTRGLGAEVARHLVACGARRLVIMGREPLPPQGEWTECVQSASTEPALREKIAHLLALRAAGAELELYTGSLVDRERLQACLNRARQWGMIRGVVHCAGAATGRPGLVDKSASDVASVYEPKIQGLQVLDELLGPDPLRFFVVFSSVSAVSPRLAVGLSDYATANAFMNAFAAHRARQGRTCYRAVSWPSWRDAGRGEVKSWIYGRLGLSSLATRDGLALLDRIIAGDEPCIVPLAVVPETFSALTLLAQGASGAEAAGVATGDAALAGRESIPSPAAVSRDSGNMSTFERFRIWLNGVVSAELRLQAGELQDRAHFEDLGVDSVVLGRLVPQIERALGVSIEPSVFFDHPTLAQLAAHLCERHGERVRAAFAGTEEARAAVPTHEARVGVRTEEGVARAEGGVLGMVAVVGVGCHFPGGSGKEGYWELLQAGRSGIVEVPRSRWDTGRFYAEQPMPGRSISRWGGFLEGIEEFDAEYFRIRDEVASHLDPLARQFLEVSAETFADAGYGSEELKGKRVGVFVGSRVSSYANAIERPLPDSIVGIGQNFIAAHVSHFFDLKGPNLVVDTACSSSLVSVHLGCQSVLSGESELALAGGVDVLLDERPYLILSEARALSPDGRCRAFDEGANGLVPGEGCGAVLLKSLGAALADGDRIYAVIEGTAVNNDGQTMGMTTPNPEAQKDVIREALRRAGVRARTIGYMEAHGTGTMIGDPIELRALTQVHRESTGESGYCAVGSVKSNVGHLLSAAGIASLIKTVLCLERGVLVPTLHCERPNPRFAFGESPFYPGVERKAWMVGAGEVRRAGVSSFGFGGTNAHAVLRECPPGRMARRSALPQPRFNRKRHWPRPEPPAPESSPRRTRVGTRQLAFTRVQ